LLSYDGKNFGAMPLRPGFRSPLGDFMLSHDMIFKEGLMSGTLSTAWPLLNLSERNVKLTYEGMKKIDNRQEHELHYVPRKGSDVKVKLFFEAETFRHVRTEYEHTLAAALGSRISGGGISSSGSSSVKNETRYRMVEHFSNFKPEGGLMLPHTYKLHMSVQGPVQVLLDCVLDLTQFAFNQKLNPKDFTTQS